MDTGIDILGTSVNATNGAISAQTGDSVNGEVECNEAEWWQHVGFASRPSKAEPGKPACQAVSIETTGRDVCIASRDIRGTKIYGSLGNGETCVFANGPDGSGTGLVLLSDDGNKATVKVGVKQGNQSGGSEVSIAVSSDGKVTVTSGPTVITVDASGTVNVQATSMSIDAATVTLGTGAALGVALGPQVQAFLASYQATLAALQVAITAQSFLPGPGVNELALLQAALTTNATLTANIPGTASQTVKATP